MKKFSFKDYEDITIPAEDSSREEIIDGEEETIIIKDIPLVEEEEK